MLAGSHGRHRRPGGLCLCPPCPGVCVPEESPVPLILRVSVPWGWGVHGVPHPCTAILWGVPAPTPPSGQVPWMSPCAQEPPGERGSGLRVHFIPAEGCDVACPCSPASQGLGSATQMPWHHATHRSNRRGPHWSPRCLLIPGECPVPGTLAGGAGSEGSAACFRSSRTPSSTC